MPYSQRWRLRWFDETTNVLRSELPGLQCWGVGDPWQEKWAQKRENSFYPLPPCFCLVFLHHLSPFCQRGSHQLPLLFISFCILWVTFPCVHQHASTICRPHDYLVLCLETLLRGCFPGATTTSLLSPLVLTCLILTWSAYTLCLPTECLHILVAALLYYIYVWFQTR